MPSGIPPCLSQVWRPRALGVSRAKLPQCGVAGHGRRRPHRDALTGIPSVVPVGILDGHESESPLGQVTHFKGARTVGGAHKLRRHSCENAVKRQVLGIEHHTHVLGRRALDGVTNHPLNRKGVQGAARGKGMHQLLGGIALVDVHNALSKLEHVGRVFLQSSLPRELDLAAAHNQIHGAVQWGAYQQLGTPLTGLDVLVKGQHQSVGHDLCGTHHRHRCNQGRGRLILGASCRGTDLGTSRDEKRHKQPQCTKRIAHTPVP